MPSLTHESVVDLLRECPWLALTLWRDLLGQPVPEGARVEDASAAISEIRPAEYRADQALRVLERDGRLFGALIVEVQLRIDPDKPFTWPHYVTSVRARLRCPVAIMVITFDERVARWAGQTIDLGFGQGSLTPVVLGPAALGYATASMAAVRMRTMLYRQSPMSLAVLVAACGIAGQVVTVGLLTARGLPWLLDERIPGWDVASPE